jgi:hypothetical protein
MKIAGTATLRTTPSLIIIPYIIASLMSAGTIRPAAPGLTAPTLEVSPRLDEIATSVRPVLAWDNSAELSRFERDYSAVLKVITSTYFLTSK